MSLPYFVLVIAGGVLIANSISAMLKIICDRGYPHLLQIAPFLGKFFGKADIGLNSVQLNSERAERLQALCGTTDLVLVTNNAFILLEWAIRGVHEGDAIARINKEEKTITELDMDILHLPGIGS
jgi:hypothetical protein